MSLSVLPFRPARLAALVALCAACALPAAADVNLPGNAALVNGTPITNERLERAFEEYLTERQINIAAIRNPASAKRYKRETLDLLVEQELLWQEARRRKLEATPKEVEAAIASIRAGFETPEAFARRLAAERYDEKSYAAHMHRLLSARNVLAKTLDAVKVTDADVHAFYEKNQARFQRPEQAKLSHLYLPYAEGMGEPQKEALRVRARELLAKARAGGDFAALVREHSKGSSAAEGGELGFVARADLAAPLGEAAFAAPVGGVTDVVELPDGLHLLKVHARRPAESIPEADGREPIRAHLQREKAQAAREALLARLHAAARVEVLAPLPPVAQIADEKTSPAQRARALLD